MRLGIVLAATGATVASAWAFAAAQEGFDTRNYRPAEQPTQRTVRYFSRNGSTSQQTIQLRPTAQPEATDASPSISLSRNSAPKNYYNQLFRDSNVPQASPIHTAGGVMEESDASLVHARYDRSRDAAPATEIRQLSSQAPQSTLGAPQSHAAALEAFAAPGAEVEEAEADPFAAFESSRTAIAPSAAQRHVMSPAPAETAFPGATAVQVPVQSEPVEPAATAPSLNYVAGPTLGAPAEPVARGSYATPIPTERRESPVTRPTAIPTTPSAIEPASANEPTHRLAAAHMGGPAAVEVKWERVSEITVGRECRCELVVKNSGVGAASNVAVEAFFPASVRLIDADPKPSTADDHLTWTVPSLAAGAEKSIAITLIPSEQGDLQVSAFVRYTEAAATTLAVREPQLNVTMDGPAEVAIGETVSQTITVSNPGTGSTDDVTVEVTLPPGLEHAKGTKISMPIGSLSAGQSQVIRLALFATQGGTQSIQVRATAGQSLRHDAAANVIVSAPTLKVIAEGPSLRYVGRDAVYRIRVTNDGGAAANNVRVTHAVPSGFDFVRADKGGKYEAGPSQIVWYVGRVEAGQSVDLAAELTATELGDHKHVVTITGEGGATSQTVIDTAVDGTASLVVEVLDLDDPVEVGAETAYEVRVRNEGTKAASNVAISCQVPSGVAALSARGPTAHQGEASMLTFAPIDELEPGKTALYRVVVRGTAAGKHRFRVRLTSDSIDEPLVHEELTHYYAD